MNHIEGNLLDITDGIIVHGCNCDGAMGAGIAKAIADKYPWVKVYYGGEHGDNGLQLGTCQVLQGKSPYVKKFDYEIEYEGDHVVDAFIREVPPELIIVNAMTQRHPGSGSLSYEAIFSCFARINLVAKMTKKKIYFPLIGCGIAGGQWELVESQIQAALEPMVFRDATLVTLPGAKF